MTNTNDNRPVEDRARDTAHDAADKARDLEHDAAGKARTVGQRVSDAIEDVIPGDSDGDGH